MIMNIPQIVTPSDKVQISLYVGQEDRLGGVKYHHLLNTPSWPGIIKLLQKSDVGRVRIYPTGPSDNPHPPVTILLSPDRMVAFFKRAGLES